MGKLPTNLQYVLKVASCTQQNMPLSNSSFSEPMVKEMPLFDKMLCCPAEIGISAFLKGELNLDNKWQSDDLFYIIMNEIHPRFNQFCVILKLS